MRCKRLSKTNDNLVWVICIVNPLMLSPELGDSLHIARVNSVYFSVVSGYNAFTNVYICSCFRLNNYILDIYNVLCCLVRQRRHNYNVLCCLVRQRPIALRH